MKIVLGVLAGLTAPLFVFAVYLLIFKSLGNGLGALLWAGVVLVLALIYFGLININFTSPHRHYRRKLAEAYVIQPAKVPQLDRPFDNDVTVKLSAATSASAPYHLINAALNLPGSKNPRVQGRLTDFFLFGRDYCGSPISGYHATAEWERMDWHLDLGTALAISGAAAAPQMGLGTRRRLSFWLTLRNVRLGYWLRQPRRDPDMTGRAPRLMYFLREMSARSPGLFYLLREMTGLIDERLPRLYLSDGGHLKTSACTSCSAAL
jgi:hypothetical protein